MLKSFFFVPANNQKFLNNIKSIKSDFFVFDLEDSIPNKDINMSLKNLKQIKINDNYLARIRFGGFEKNSIESTILDNLISLGFKKFLIPKISNLEELEKLDSYLKSNELYEFEKFQFILLVENPKCLISLRNLINSKTINIIGVTLGSHDYSNNMRMKHSHQYLSFARNYVLNIAKAFELLAIDIASMNIENSIEFKNECIDAFNMGYDAKFILHPMQLQSLKKSMYYDEKEITHALEVYKEIKSLGMDKFSVIKLNGKLYEKAHLARIKAILEWYKNFNN